MALLEPDKNRRRRVCEMTSLSFGEPRGCDIERSGERVVVAWEHGITVHNFDGGEPLLAPPPLGLLRLGQRLDQWSPIMPQCEHL